MKRYASYLTLYAAMLLPACASVNLSPEQQIKTGADTGTAVAVSVGVVLKRDRITVGQAKSYSSLLHAGRDHLNDANVRLVDCRKKTGSTQATVPDPCKNSVADDIRLGLTVIGDVDKIIKEKQ